MRRHIGHWLRRADTAITAHLDATLAAVDLTRHEWQALNVLASGFVSRDDLASALRAFSDAEALDTLLSGFARRSWLVEGPRLALTRAGSQAHERAHIRVAAARARARDGISDDDYGRTLQILARIVDNLEAPLPSNPAGAGGPPSPAQAH